MTTGSRADVNGAEHEMGATRQDTNVFYLVQGVCGSWLKFLCYFEVFFLIYFPNRTLRLKDGAPRIFPISYAATGNQTHFSSVAPLLRDLNPECFTD